MLHILAYISHISRAFGTELIVLAFLFNTAQAIAAPCLIFVHGSRATSNTASDPAAAYAYWTGAVENPVDRLCRLLDQDTDLIKVATGNFTTSYYVVGYDGSQAYDDAAIQVANAIFDATSGNEDPGGHRCSKSWEQGGNFWVITHSGGATVLDYILGNTIEQASPNYDARFAAAARRLDLVISLSGAHRGAQSADAICGPTNVLCDTYASLFSCTPARQALQSLDVFQVFNAAGPPVRTVFLTGGYKSLDSFCAGFSIGACLSGQDDGVVQYASSFACDGSATTAYSNYNVCGNNSKQEVTGFRNLDAVYEDHDTIRNDVQRYTIHAAERVAVPDGIWTCDNAPCEPGTTVAESFTSAALIAYLVPELDKSHTPTRTPTANQQNSSRTATRTNTRTRTPSPSGGGHTVTIFSGPSGSPNPVQQGGVVNLSVAASESTGMAVAYRWSAGCPLTGVAETFSDEFAQNPRWTAPASVAQECSICVRAVAGNVYADGCFTQVVSGSSTTCTSFSINRSSLTVNADAGSREISITGSPTGCIGGGWTASDNRSWLAVSPTSGSGPDTATVSWTENTGAARSGTATIAGSEVHVDQDQGSNVCELTLSRSAPIETDFEGDSRRVRIFASPDGCTGGDWTASTNAPWLTLSKTNGTGADEVYVFWTENPVQSPRSGTVTIAGYSFAVNQEAAPPPPMPGTFIGDGSGDNFGEGVSISEDAATMLIGADGTNDRVAYVFMRSAVDWTRASLQMPDVIGSNDQYGLRLALSGDGAAALVAAHQKTINGNTRQGAVYPFIRDGVLWTPQAALIAPDGFIR